MHKLRLLAILATASLLGCGNDGAGGESAPSSQAQAPSRTAESIDWSSYPLSLFSDSLHDIPMPDPGKARVEIYGQVLEGQLMRDCSAPIEVPEQVHDRTDHRFQIDFQVQMEDRYANVRLMRRVIPAHYDPQIGPIEMENVHVRTHARGGQTLDIRHHSLERYRSDQPPRVSAITDKRPQPATSMDELPGLRIHPDGRRATFVGRLGKSDEFENSEFPDWEDVRIAVHCGPL
jgi:hypothetical protein